MPPAPQALAEAITDVLEDLDGYRERARARAAERFDLAPWVARHVALFEELLA